MSILTEVTPKVNHDTVLFLAQADIPERLRPVIPLMAQLPVNMHIVIIEAASRAGLGLDGAAEGFRAAVEFQNQARWRCASCYRWLDRMNLPICCSTEHGVKFAAVCPRCERRHRTDEALRRAIAGYVGEEVQS